MQNLEKEKVLEEKPNILASNDPNQKAKLTNKYVFWFRISEDTSLITLFLLIKVVLLFGFNYIF